VEDTVNLPHRFPMKANLPTAEPEMLARWAFPSMGRSARARTNRNSSCTTARRMPTATFIGTALNKF
jgi:hypothetical protein